MGYGVGSGLVSHPYRSGQPFAISPDAAARLNPPLYSVFVYYFFFYYYFFIFHYYDLYIYIYIRFRLIFTRITVVGNVYYN